VHPVPFVLRRLCWRRGSEAGTLRGHQREVLPDVGHFPQRERPDIVAAAIHGSSDII
jgi:pimeloyl-ACP methyl ester carboxylesterase